MPRQRRATKKFMMVLDMNYWKQLQRLGQQRGVTVQELLRVEAVPRYVATENRTLPPNRYYRRLNELDRRLETIQQTLTQVLKTKRTRRRK